MSRDMMGGRLAPFALVLVVTCLVLGAARLTPYFAGDVAVARAVQALSPDDAWAQAVTSTALPPLKYAIVVAAAGVAWLLAGWRGAALVVAAALVEEHAGDAAKRFVERPRPSPTLVTVVGTPTGFSFPSTFTTFYGATFGTLLVLAWRATRTRASLIVAAGSSVAILVGWAARVALGAHWPSDVVLATVLTMAWIWAVARAVVPRR